MKPIGESAEVFAAYARIDFRNYEMKRLVVMLDECFDQLEITKINNQFKELLLGQVDDKKFIEADYEAELLALHNIDTI